MSREQHALELAAELARELMDKAGVGAENTMVNVTVAPDGMRPFKVRVWGGVIENAREIDDYSYDIAFRRRQAEGEPDTILAPGFLATEPTNTEKDPS